MMTAWSHLPNAAHIDRIIASVKAHPEAWYAARDAAWYATRAASWSAAYDAARDAAWKAARDTAWDAAWGATGEAGLGAIAVLIAWDNSAKFLGMTPDELKVWRALSEDPAAILLLPAVIAFQRIEQLELA